MIASVHKMIEHQYSQGYFKTKITFSTSIAVHVKTAEGRLRHAAVFIFLKKNKIMSNRAESLIIVHKSNNICRNM